MKFLPDEIADAVAIEAWALGTATEDQQKRAFKCVVNELCGTYEQSFDPDNQHITAFNEGRRQVGRALVGLLHANLTLLYAEANKKAAVKTIEVNRKRKSNG